MDIIKRKRPISMKDYYNIVKRLRSEADFVKKVYIKDCLSQYVNSPIVEILEEAAVVIEKLLSSTKG